MIGSKANKPDGKVEAGDDLKSLPMPELLAKLGISADGLSQAEAQIQHCIVHMVRNAVKYVPWKDYKSVTSVLKRNYQASTEELAL